MDKKAITISTQHFATIVSILQCLKNLSTDVNISESTVVDAHKKIVLLTVDYNSLIVSFKEVFKINNNIDKELPESRNVQFITELFEEYLYGSNINNNLYLLSSSQQDLFFESLSLNDKVAILYEEKGSEYLNDISDLSNVVIDIRKSITDELIEKYGEFVTVTRSLEG